VIAAAGADRLVVVDPHTPAIEAMSTIAVETLTAVPLLAHALAPAEDGSVIVAPDLGAVKLAERYAARLGLPVAVVRKTRATGTSVRAEELVGEVRDRLPIIVDDMISTGGTIEAAARLVAERGARRDVVVAATHGLLVGTALTRLQQLAVRRLLVTDTVEPIGSGTVEACSVSGLLAEAIGRLHAAKRLDDLEAFG
jgi:ribose-phosphate pyrophosphokinase